MASIAGMSTASDSTVPKKGAGFWWYRISDRSSIAAVCPSVAAVRARRHSSGKSATDAWAWVATVSASSR
jgi:hypothetical protein